MYCKKCGKQIEDNVAFCHWCGAQQKEDPQSETASASEKKELNVLCVLGLVISGVSLLLNFWGVVGIAGTVLSLLGYFDCDKKGERGKILAIVGIILGCFSVAYAVFYIIGIGSWFQLFSSYN